jgi:murein DD-endopeptidase MepM/ murein hydrolase activator NlpD
LRLGVPTVPALCGLFVFASSMHNGREEGPVVASAAPLYSAELVSEDDAAVDLPPLRVPDVVVLERGETLSSLLARLGLEGPAQREILLALSETVELRKLRPGVSLVARMDGDDRLAELVVVQPGRGETLLRPEGERWQSVWRPSERSSLPARLAGTLQSSLAALISQAGGPASLTYSLAEVLQWDLDFTRDLREGDTLEVFYEEELLDGRRTGGVRVLAARYVNRGRAVEAYRYGDSGYYDAEGRPLRKRFLRSPLKFSRISSRFSKARLHPVLKVVRPHLGVDYAAPTGTPVRVTSNGVVSFVGWDRGGGRTIKVRHGSDYETAYLHLSKYAAGLRTGQRVLQGEVVGYVGSTGLSTAPHLDYRVKFRGRWIDPLTLGAEPAEPLEADELPRFMASRERYRAVLEGAELPSVEVARLAVGAQPPELQAGS